MIAVKKHEGARVIHNLAGILFPAVDPAAEWSNLALKQIRDDLADFVIYQSEFTRKACEEFIGPAPCPWEIVPNAVDEHRFTPPDVREKRNVLLAVGLHRHEQRMGAMLNALAVVRRSVPDVRLKIAGPIRAEGLGAVKDLMEERIRVLGLEDCVELLGEVLQEDLPDLYRSASVLLHPASIDWCPKVVIEAMACGLPVAYALHGGTPELVRDAGIGVPIDEPSWQRMPEIDCEEYAAAVLKILENEEDLSRRARERVLANYTLERSVETHRRIFEQTLSGPRHASGAIGLKHPMFYFKHDLVPVMYVEWDGEPMSYIRAYITDFTQRVAPVFSGRVDGPPAALLPLRVLRGGCARGGKHGPCGGPARNPGSGRVAGRDHLPSGSRARHRPRPGRPGAVSGAPARRPPSALYALPVPDPRGRSG